MVRINQVVRAAVGMLVVILAGGCSSFGSKWEAAGQKPTPLDGVEGRWQGTWVSEVNGHSGELQCVLSKGKENTYDADFHATFWTIFSASYSVPLHVKASDGTPDPMYVYLEGDSTLGGMLGGTFHYDGRVGPTQFVCTYRSASDHGTFQMVRPGGTAVSYRPRTSSETTTAADASRTGG